VVVPPRMTHAEIYRTMASSTGAMQLIQALNLSQSTHNMENENFQHGDGTPIKEQMKSCQESSCSDSCTPRSLHQ
jgi:hypothetical protein